MTTRRPSDGDRSMRYPAVAGGFYERSRDALARQIKECYTHPLGPGRVPDVRRGDRRLVRICMAFQEYEVAAEVGELVADAVKGRDVVLIASSDFTHVGSQYLQLPPRGMSAPEFAKEQDSKAIEMILALDPKRFAAKVAQAEISMCGYGPVAAMLTAAKQLGADRVKLLKYATSSDVSRDSHMAVGYGAIGVYR